MTNKKNTFNKVKLYFLLSIGLLYVPVYKVFAALEIQYPKIADQTLTAGSKLPDFVLYLFNAGMVIGLTSVVISLIMGGVMYLFSPINAEMKTRAKDRFSGATAGLLILVLTYLIVTTINPQLKHLTLTGLPATPQASAPTQNPGIYLNGDTENPYISSIPDLGTLKNSKLDSISVVQGDSAYMAIAYDNVDFWGKCQDVGSGKSGLNWVESISIHTLNNDPNGDGVYFYRKSYFDQKGGYLKVGNGEIGGGGGSIYVKKLEDLKFTGVPEDEQDCIKYDKNGICDKDGRKPPTLGGENISSIKIKGDYVVILVYLGPDDNEYGPWTSCQEFPTIEDVNKIGPQQIKWENIRNNKGLIPNYVIIIPI